MPTLTIGASGDDVLSLQLALVAIGLLGGEPSGSFDQVTQRAVIEMQRRARLPQTGVMNEASWNALFTMQAEAAPLTGGEVNPTPRPEGTTEFDPINITAPSRGTLFFIFAAVAGATYWWQKKKLSYAGRNEDEDEDDDDDGEDIDFVPPSHRRKARLADLDDAVTDSLLDEPAVVASSGRPGDCKKAARMLLSRSGLAQSGSERSLYERVVKKVASDCREQEAAVQEAIAEEAERREDLTDALLEEVGQSVERDRATDRDRDNNISARLKAQSKWKKRHDPAEDDGGPTILTHGDRQSRKKLYESGFRKSKLRLTKKTTTTSKKPGWKPNEKELLDTVAHTHRPGRRGAATVGVRKKSGEKYRIRKEKAKTKRGYTWRKED